MHLRESIVKFWHRNSDYLNCYNRKQITHGLPSPIRHAQVPNGLSRRIIRARSAKRQTDLAIATFFDHTTATEKPCTIVMRITMKIYTLFSCPPAMTPHLTCQCQLVSVAREPYANRRNRQQSTWCSLASILPACDRFRWQQFLLDTFRDNLPSVG